MIESRNALAGITVSMGRTGTQLTRVGYVVQINLDLTSIQVSQLKILRDAHVETTKEILAKQGGCSKVMQLDSTTVASPV
jgi:hypothetical protein